MQPSEPWRQQPGQPPTAAPGAPQGHPGTPQGHPGAPQGHPGAPQGAPPGVMQGRPDTGLHRGNHPNPQHYRPPAQRSVIKVGAPLALIIVCGVLMLLLLGLIFLANPLAMLLGALVSAVAIGVVLFCYLILDRWEPEPPRLLLLAFLWGAGLSTAVAMVFNTLAGALFGGVFATIISAPFVEELIKGAFLLFMLTGRRRKELTSLVDHLVFAGVVAAGFAWTEDILYLVDNAENFTGVAVVRLVFSPFAHPLFTTMTALGVYYGGRKKSSGAKVGLTIAGFAGAMLLHFIWNAAPTLFGTVGLLVMYVLFMVPVFGGLVVVAIMARRREQQLVVKALPGLVRDKIITPAQGHWLGTSAGRKEARTLAKQQGPQVLKATRTLIDASTELAFARDRIDKGLDDARSRALHAELTETIAIDRRENPYVDQIPAVGPPPAVPGQRAPAPIHPPQPAQQGQQPPSYQGQPAQSYPNRPPAQPYPNQPPQGHPGHAGPPAQQPPQQPPPR
ncbi:PrsW family glutamic-type intramembrane protease [Microlunatus sp. Y2014]|uniref:PrsW family glutamic-type intramembrane protease n=1 Tax=Microlunatus sp. Y2014 TaxID=3418488 RepID=UPI003DA7057B